MLDKRSRMIDPHESAKASHMESSVALYVQKTPEGRDVVDGNNLGSPFALASDISYLSPCMPR